MPRRQQITIPIEKLSVYDALVTELSENPLLEDYDLDTVNKKYLAKMMRVSRPTFVHSNGKSNRNGKFRSR